MTYGSTDGRTDRRTDEQTPLIQYKNLGGTFVRFVTIHACVGQTHVRTDGRTYGETDRRTDTFAIRKTALYM